MTRHSNRIGAAQRADTHHVEGAGHACPRREQPLELCRADLADDADLTLFDMRKEGVEQTLRALVVLPRIERLLQLRQDPDNVPVAHPLYKFLRPALELPDVHRAGVDLRRRGLEHDQRSRRAVECRPQKRGLAHAVFADQQQRARRRVLQRLADLADDLAAITDEKRLGPVVGRLPERADFAQKTRIDDRGAPGLEQVPEIRTEARFVHADEVSDALDDVERKMLCERRL